RRNARPWRIPSAPECSDRSRARQALVFRNARGRTSDPGSEGMLRTAKIRTEPSHRPFFLLTEKYVGRVRETGLHFRQEGSPSAGPENPSVLHEGGQLMPWNVKA